MNGWLPFALVLIVGFTWLVTARQHGRLFRLFLTRYPHEATNLIPYAISNWRHPEQIIYFFRKSSVPLLKADPELWKKRESVKALFLAFRTRAVNADDRLIRLCDPAVSSVAPSLRLKDGTDLPRTGDRHALTASRLMPAARAPWDYCAARNLGLPHSRNPGGERLIAKMCSITTGVFTGSVL
jgi:hypothetical protein